MVDTSLLTAVLELVKQVGHYQLSLFRTFSAHPGSEKKPREFVSSVDTHSEEMLMSGLENLLPEAGFYGEETGIHGNETLRWVIDPLDGTTNFLSGLEQFSISVALEHNQQTQLGIVFRPASQEYFSALRGKGFYHNGQCCQKHDGHSLNLALLGTGFPFRSPDLAGYFFPCAEDVLYKCRGLRRFGSAALDLCYVAAGFLQGFWESDLEPYDIAAAMLFLEEAGCPASNQRGESYSAYQDRILICGCPTVHRELLPLIATHYPSSL